MLRLIIVDDNRFIREITAQSIDWQSLDIEVIGTCPNGAEAYNLILDEYPDIVLTDIQMPLLSGLELIKQVHTLDLDIEFIIFTGHSDISFAIDAMKYGVQHYLIKPCRKEEIISVVNQVVAKCYEKRSLRQSQNINQERIHKFEQHMIANAIISSLSVSDKSMDDVLTTLTPYMDVYHTSYILYIFEPLSEPEFDSLFNTVNTLREDNYPESGAFSIYTNDTLYLFFKQGSFNEDACLQFKSFAKRFVPDNKLNIFLQTKPTHYKCLAELLENLLRIISQYDSIYLWITNQKLLVHNYKKLSKLYNISHMELCLSIPKEQVLNQLLDIFSSINDLTVLKSLISNFLLNNYFHKKSNFSPSEMLQFIADINNCTSTNKLFLILKDKIYDIYSINTASAPNKHKEFIERILNYINENYSNPNLTLKWIAEHYLYMNVDYVSKQFNKQVGIKFSAYLSNIRIEKAKSLLLERGNDGIYEVANLTGFGNNPQYFSQTFKKNTGMTPTEFINLNKIK